MSQPNYRLGKKILQSSPVSKTFNIQNSRTDQVWRAKVFDLNKIHQYEMLSVLEYNQEVFAFLKDKYQNSLYIENTFQKDDKDFMLFEYWNERLSDYILKNPQGLKDQQQVKAILQDVLMSVCDIYVENYMILNLRPEQIVRVSDPAEGSLGWKIESLVFQYNLYGMPLKCQYEFDYDWASNQEKQDKQKLDQSLKDEQIVWYMGVLALRLVYGINFKVSSKFKDSDLDLTQLRRVCLPEVYELIQKSVKSNLKDRIPLKKFLNLSVFSKVQITSDVRDKFISGHSDRINKSCLMRSKILERSISRKNSEMFKMTVSSRIYFPQTSAKNQAAKSIQNSGKNQTISEIKAQKIFNSLRWLLEKCFYIAQIKDYTQTNASLVQTSAQDKTLIRYLYFKIADINLNRFIQIIEKQPSLQAFRTSPNSKNLLKDLQNSIDQNRKSSDKKPIPNQASQYESKVRKLDPKQLKLLSGFEYIASNLKKSIETKNIRVSDLVDYLILVNGRFYASLKRYMDDEIGVQNKGIKLKALCFFALSSYIILVSPNVYDPEQQLELLIKDDFSIYKKKFYDDQRLLGSVHDKFADQVEYIRLVEFTKNAPEDFVLDNTRSILQKYFKTDPINQRPQVKSQQIVRTSFKVPSRYDN